MRVSFRSILFFISIFNFAFAQDSVSVRKGPEPFEGVITYTIDWSGKAVTGITDLLPDSMQLWVKYPWMRVKYFGGLSDTLFSDFIWNAGNNGHFIINHSAELVHRITEIKDSTTLRPIATTEKLRVLNFDCKKYYAKIGDSSFTWYFAKDIFIERGVEDTLNFGRPPFLAMGFNQIPLSFISKNDDAKVQNKAKRIQRMKLSLLDFEYPSGYKLEEFDSRANRHPLVPALPEN